jgi:hypothetical protein
MSKTINCIHLYTWFLTCKSKRIKSKTIFNRTDEIYFHVHIRYKLDRILSPVLVRLIDRTAMKEKLVYVETLGVSLKDFLYDTM